MAMTSSATSSTALGTPPPSDSELSDLGGIEALNLKVGPVRRSLFGPVDHRQLQQDFQRMLSMNVEVASKRWSFDFEGDRPVRGLGRSEVQWEAMRCQDVPAFYRSCTVRGNAVGGGRKAVAPSRRSASPSGPSSSSSSSDEGSPGSSSSSSADDYLDLASRRCHRLQRPIKRKQANITDFFRVKKRRLLHYKGSSRQ